MVYYCCINSVSRETYKKGGENMTQHTLSEFQELLRSYSIIYRMAENDLFDDEGNADMTSAAFDKIKKMNQALSKAYELIENAM